MSDINMTMDNGKPEILMTGQEWYDKYEKEKIAILMRYAKNGLLTNENAIIGCDEAAKKAAGLE